MDIIFWILLTLSGPVFYITGLVVFIKWLARGGRPSAGYSGGKSAAAKLREYASKQPPETARDLGRLADELEGRTPAAFTSPESPAATRFEPGQVHPSAPEPTPDHPPVPALAHTAPVVPATSWTQMNVSDITRSLDNINVLLYLGAFLVVVSAGIFVGYNFSTLSGLFKTTFLGLFAGIFYGVGLLLFLRARKLRPAGVTFTGIGLILVPLVGLAAYNFTSLHDHRAATWLVTSLLTLAIYAVTIAVTRQTYIAYLMAFTTLSTFESAVSLFNLPVYWFGWGMATVSILLLSLDRLKLFWEDAASALALSANVFVPVSLLISALCIDADGLSQLGVTIGLAGVFYAAMTARNSGKPAGDAYWSLALVSLPAALGVGLWDSLPRTGVAAAVLAVTAAYYVAGHLLGGRLSHRWRELLAAVTGILPLAGILVLYDHPGAISIILGGAVLVNGETALRLRQSALGLMAIIALLALPEVFLRSFMNPALPWSSVAALLLVEVPALVWWARRMKDWPESGRAVGMAGYLIALGLALICAALSSETALLVVGVIIAGILYALSILEQRFEYIYFGAVSLYLGIVQLPSVAHWSSAANALVLLATGAALYGLGNIETDPVRAKAVRYSGVVGPFIGAFLGIEFESRHLEPVLALATGGGLLMAEAKRSSNSMLFEVAGAILVLSFNWFLSVQQITQTQGYTLPWAAYLGYLGYRRRHRGHEGYDAFVAGALGVLTIPLAGQALASDGQVYGLLLILEAIALVFLGMALSYKLVTLWGVATLVLEVLYQLRDFFYALPKYVISAGLGLALLAVAIVMLQRRKGND